MLLLILFHPGALEDFKKSDEVKKEETKSDSTSKEVSTSSDGPLDAEDWSTDFIQRTATQFEENFATLLAGNDANIQLTPEFVQQKLQQMAGTNCFVILIFIVIYLNEYIFQFYDV